jgi:hypothetical protein
MGATDELGVVASGSRRDGPPDPAMSGSVGAGTGPVSASSLPVGGTVPAGWRNPGDPPVGKQAYGTGGFPMDVMLDECSP